MSPFTIEIRSVNVKGRAYSTHGNRILARGLMVPRSGAVCSCSHAPSRPRHSGHSGSFVDQRRTSLHTTKEIFNIRSPCLFYQGDCMLNASSSESGSAASDRREDAGKVRGNGTVGAWGHRRFASL